MSDADADADPVENPTPQLQNAVTRVQSVYRGYKARQEYRRKLIEALEKEEEDYFEHEEQELNDGLRFLQDAQQQEQEADQAVLTTTQRQREDEAIRIQRAYRMYSSRRKAAAARALDEVRQYAGLRSVPGTLLAAVYTAVSADASRRLLEMRKATDVPPQFVDKRADVQFVVLAKEVRAIELESRRRDGTFVLPSTGAIVPGAPPPRPDDPKPIGELVSAARERKDVTELMVLRRLGKDALLYWEGERLLLSKETDVALRWRAVQEASRKSEVCRALFTAVHAASRALANSAQAVRTRSARQLLRGSSVSGPRAASSS